MKTNTDIVLNVTLQLMADFITFCLITLLGSAFGYAFEYFGGGEVLHSLFNTTPHEFYALVAGVSYTAAWAFKIGKK